MGFNNVMFLIVQAQRSSTGPVVLQLLVKGTNNAIIQLSIMKMSVRRKKKTKKMFKLRKKTKMSMEKVQDIDANLLKK